jgi:hypothetical protein
VASPLRADPLKAATIKKAIVLLWGLLLVACATPPAGTNWPATLPPHGQFAEVWQGDAANRELQSLDDYSEWVLRFYQGNNLVPGWLGMTAQLQERIPASEWSAIGERLSSLGAQIAGEWAKENSQRRITTRCASVWRDALQEALSRNDLNPFLLRLQSDVDALLAGSLDADQIRFERYYVDEFDF